MKFCKHCGEESGKHDMPVERGFSLFGYEFLIRYWKEEYLEECFECIADIQNERHRETYRAGKEDGYREAMQENRGLI